MKEHSWTTMDKTEWGPGPWMDEPDKRQWQDPATGLPCLIVRNSGVTGSLCGYVGVSKDHPAHGLGYYHQHYQEDDAAYTAASAVELAIDDIQVHGGLTYAGGCDHGDDPSTGICHIPYAGEPDDIHWFGFDCAHCHDLTPKMAIHFPSDPDDVYRDIAYVTEQVTSLARQLAEIK